MTIVLPPGYGHVDLAFRHSGYQRDAHVTFGIEDAGAHGSPAGAVSLIYGDNLQPRMDSNVTLRSVEVAIGQDGGEPIIDRWDGSAVGGVSRSSTTAALAVLVTKRTALGGRRNVGRFFWPWFTSEDSVSELGVIGSGDVNAMQLRFNDLRNDLESEGIPMCLLHRTGTTAVPDPTTVTSLQVSNVVSTQRRRQLRNV